jgi:phosphoribosylformylglycinamidine synthase
MEKSIKFNMKVKSLVIRSEGTNCDLETVEALRLAGSQVDLLHINRIIKNPSLLEEYQLLVFPGGFSFGDCISAGKILSNILKTTLKKELKKFIDEGKPVLGICNGFQTLLKLGALPFSDEFEQCASLVTNSNGLFIDKWVYLKFNRTKCIFTKDSPNVIYLPINHKEGRFVIEEKFLKKLVDNEQIIYQYSSQSGEVKEEYNPNGSTFNIAAICNEHYNVLGIMPHPEKYVHKYQHPSWTRYPNLKEEGEGLLIFKNALNYAKKF